MVKLNDIEKKLQNYQERVEYNVRYENSGEKRVYTVYPGRALEFIKQAAANSPMPPFLRRPDIKGNSTVEYKIEESNGVINGQSFTVKTPASSSDFGRENIGGSDLWNSSIFGSGREFNNQRTLEFRQPSNQDFSVIRSQSQIHNQDIGICCCNSIVKKTLLDDWNRCLKCGGMFDDAGTEEAERRQKAHLEKFRREQEEYFREKQGEEERFKQEFMSGNGSSSNSCQQRSYPEPQSRFMEIDENDIKIEEKATKTQFFQQQQQQHVLKEKRLTETINTSRGSGENKLPKTVLIAGSLIVLVSGISLLYFLKKRHTKGNKYGNN